jgi:hypothetical protein
MELKPETNDPGMSTEGDDPNLTGQERGIETGVNWSHCVTTTSKDLEMANTFLC